MPLTFFPWRLKVWMNVPSLVASPGPPVAFGTGPPAAVFVTFAACATPVPAHTPTASASTPTSAKCLRISLT